MKKLLLASAFALTLATTYASADGIVITDDPLHGYCAGCTAGNTNTPIFQAPGGTVQQFGFTSSPGITGGTLELVVMVPDTTNLGSFIAPTVSGSGTGTVAQFTNGFSLGISDFSAGILQGTNPTLAAFLALNSKPDNNLANFLGATNALETTEGLPLANGYFVFTLTGLGPFDFPNGGCCATVPPDLFNLSNTLPDGSFITGFATDSSGNIIGTANSSSLFVNPLAVPGPIAGAGIPGIFALLMLGLARLRQKRQWWSRMAQASA